MRPVAAHVVISAPREEVFDFVGDLANRVAYTDHCLDAFRLARLKSEGRGAAARFSIRAPLGSVWAEATVVESERPKRIVEEIRIGRLGRTRALSVYEFAVEAHGMTRVELTSSSEPAHRLGAAVEGVGARRWLRRQHEMALERLRMIFEERPDAPLARVTVAGYERLKAPRFGT